MEVTVRLVDGEPTVAVQVIWQGTELNLNRAREEPVERFQQRLGLNCGKQLKQGGGDKKRARKEKKKSAGPGEGDSKTESLQCSESPGISVFILDSQGSKAPSNQPLAEALRGASYVEIAGEKLPVIINPPSIQKLEVFGQLLSGCPAVASIRSEFCKPSAIRLRWLHQVTAGVNPVGKTLGVGPVLVIPEDVVGQALTLRADAASAAQSEDEGQSRRPMKITRLSQVEAAPQGWPERRCSAFGSRRGIRVVCWNTLAAVYSRSQVATKDMYPYCPPSALDFAYRQPLIGRELVRLDGDLVFLQECSYSTYSKFLTPVFGDSFHLRISLKASKASEGCVLLVRKEAFEVLQEMEVLFRNLFLSMDTCESLRREVAAKWPDFLQGVLPHMTTVFQITVVRHVATGDVLVLANTHLFFHPNARHIRLLQLMCLLLKLQELREKHQTPGTTQLPRVILCGDLNSGAETAPIELLLAGRIASDHPDWQHSTIFSWRDDDLGTAASDEEDEPQAKPAAPAATNVGDTGVEPLPKDLWQPGQGMALTSPVGPLADAYGAAQLPFTNYVRGFNAILDWILTVGNFSVVQTLPGVSEEDLLPQGGLPSILYPSDHISIAVDLQLSPSTSTAGQGS